MKRFNFLSIITIAVLLVTAVSCTTMQPGYGNEYYSTGDRRVPNRIYVDDPYYGTIILERDPYSGRYYQSSPYGYGYPSRYYGTPYYRNDRYYRNYGYRNDGYNRQQTDTKSQQNQKKREEARKVILGDKQGQ